MRVSIISILLITSSLQLQAIPSMNKDCEPTSSKRHIPWIAGDILYNSDLYGTEIFVHIPSCRTSQAILYNHGNRGGSHTSSFTDRGGSFRFLSDSVDAVCKETGEGFILVAPLLGSGWYNSSSRMEAVKNVSIHDLVKEVSGQVEAYEQDECIHITFAMYANHSGGYRYFRNETFMEYEFKDVLWGDSHYAPKLYMEYMKKHPESRYEITHTSHLSYNTNLFPDSDNLEKVHYKDHYDAIKDSFRDFLFESVGSPTTEEGVHKLERDFNKRFYEKYQNLSKATSEYLIISRSRNIIKTPSEYTNAVNLLTKMESQIVKVLYPRTIGTEETSTSEDITQLAYSIDTAATAASNLNSMIDMIRDGKYVDA